MSPITTHGDNRILMFRPNLEAAAQVHVFALATMADRFTSEQLLTLHEDGRLVDEKADGVWIDMVRAARHYDAQVRKAVQS